MITGIVSESDWKESNAENQSEIAHVTIRRDNGSCTGHGLTTPILCEPLRTTWKAHHIDWRLECERSAS